MSTMLIIQFWKLSFFLKWKSQRRTGGNMSGENDEWMFHTTKSYFCLFSSSDALLIIRMWRLNEPIDFCSSLPPHLISPFQTSFCLFHPLSLSFSLPLFFSTFISRRAYSIFFARLQKKEQTGDCIKEKEKERDGESLSSICNRRCLISSDQILFFLSLLPPLLFRNYILFLNNFLSSESSDGNHDEHHSHDDDDHVVTFIGSLSGSQSHQPSNSWYQSDSRDERESRKEEVAILPPQVILFSPSPFSLFLPLFSFKIVLPAFLSLFCNIHIRLCPQIYIYFWMWLETLLVCILGAEENSQKNMESEEFKVFYARIIIWDTQIELLPQITYSPFLLTATFRNSSDTFVWCP